MVDFKNVDFSYGEKAVIKDLSFTVASGKNLLLFGPSGCGKTTVARLIIGLEKPDSGVISAPDNVSVVFQEDRLIDNISVLKNITLPLCKEKYAFAKQLLAEFGLCDIAGKYPPSLSGGMKRRVAIIRAAAYGGDVIILDEPFNGIDKENINTTVAILNREYTDKGKSIILISHNKKDAEYFGADILELG